jgi:hypothetical protein
MSDPRYRLATPEVIHQTIDGEIILIHLWRGTYHSLHGCGPLFFHGLLKGATAADLVDALCAETDGTRPAVEDAVGRMVAELWRVGLVKASEGEPESAAKPPSPPKRAFVEPQLETFTDLHDLLTADPIHDVEPPGWPILSRDREGRH